LPTIGLNIAVLSLTGQNNGAKRLDRVSKAYRTTLTYGLIMMVIGGTMIYVFARPLMAFFTEDQTVVRIGVEYLHIASITLCSYVILFQTVFLLQGLKKPMYAIFIGIYRQIVAPVIVFYFLAYFLDWKLDGIWWGVFGVTWSAALITLFYGRYVLHRLTEESGSN
jgi:Na+-driven multidrug efflux pump